MTAATLCLLSSYKDISWGCSEKAFQLLQHKACLMMIVMYVFCFDYGVNSLFLLVLPWQPIFSLCL